MKNLKEIMAHSVLPIVAGIGLVSLAAALISGISCYKQQPIRESIPRNVLNISSHASREIATDMDFDGKIDVLERQNAQEHSLYYKRGYGPAQNTGIEVRIVDNEFFESYDRTLFQNMVKSYYGVSNTYSATNH